MRNTCLAIVLIYKLSIGAKIGDLEWPWTAKWPLFCVILPNFAVYGARCVKVLDKAITMDNLQLLSSKKTTAEGPRDAHGINIL